MEVRMTQEEVVSFFETHFPQAGSKGLGMRVADLRPGALDLALLADERHLRPGGTVSGPSLFALADVAAYLAILAHLGPVTHVVTTNMSINFLRRPDPGALCARASILKLGRRLAVVEVAITRQGDELPVSHAVGTYAIPAENVEVS